MSLNIKIAGKDGGIRTESPDTLLYCRKVPPSPRFLPLIGFLASCSPGSAQKAVGAGRGLWKGDAAGDMSGGTLLCA